MKLNSQIKLLFALLAFALTMQSCYTEVVLPKHTVRKTKIDKDRIVNFTYTVIDTFDNDWFPDEGYYYEYRPQSSKIIKEDKIDVFLNMLYAKGYNIVGAWYRPTTINCYNNGRPVSRAESATFGPTFLILLSNVDDSIIEYDFYPLLRKPEIICPYNVEEYWVE
ncbi:MAG: hypothetical protein IPJ23_07700 [Ignavibacteriales bacterium]|nr:hypothetical protein [Ignavibacteriales bacterium]